MLSSGMKADILGFNSAISNKLPTEKMQRLPLYKHNLLFGDAKAERAKFLSLAVRYKNKSSFMLLFFPFFSCL